MNKDYYMILRLPIACLAQKLCVLLTKQLKLHFDSKWNNHINPMHIHVYNEFHHTLRTECMSFLFWCVQYFTEGKQTGWWEGSIVFHLNCVWYIGWILV